MTTIYGGLRAKRALVRESFWQRGCDDGFDGKSPQPPNSGAGPFDRENSGYYSGWNFGAAKRAKASQGEPIVERSEVTR